MWKTIFNAANFDDELSVFYLNFKYHFEILKFVVKIIIKSGFHWN